MKSINDFGPIYTETNLDSFPVEPFNTFSNLFFLAIVVYWTLQLFRKPMSPKFKTFLTFSLPVLLIGYIGGTIYHATRSHYIWLLLDFLPILILALATTFYCWRRLELSVLTVLLFFIGLIAIPQFAMYSFLDVGGLGISISYFMLIIFVLLPICIYEMRKKFKTSKYFLLAVSCIATALCFRVADSSEFVVNNLSMGTHWLWHSFGAFCCQFLILYLKDTDEAF